MFVRKNLKLSKVFKFISSKFIGSPFIIIKNRILWLSGCKAQLSLS